MNGYLDEQIALLFDATSEPNGKTVPARVQAVQERRRSSAAEPHEDRRTRRRRGRANERRAAIRESMGE